MYHVLPQRHQKRSSQSQDDLLSESASEVPDAVEEPEVRKVSCITEKLLRSAVTPAQILIKDRKEDSIQEEPRGHESYRDAIESNMNEKECLKLNISGMSFQVLRSNLLKFPETRLGLLAAAKTPSEARQHCDSLFVPTKEYFYDRSPYAFDSIASFYRQGGLHFPDHICSQSFLEEMNYWKISSDYVASCCEFKLNLANLTTQKYAKKPDDSSQAADNSAANNASNTLQIPTARLSQAQGNMVSFMNTRKRRRWRYRLSRPVIWDFLENPQSSKAALVFTIVSLSFVIATVVILILGSMPGFKHRKTYTFTFNMTNGSSDHHDVNETVTDEGLEIADAVCVVWFTVEIAVRSWAAPDRLAYLRSPLSLIDLGAVIPFYVELIMSFSGVESKTFGDFRRSLLMVRLLRALRVMRVLRVLKVARYSRGFQSVGATLKKSWKELLMLAMFMFTTNVIFSTVIYFIEGDDYEGSKFTSIPAASWWCIITMTTVGYGDVYPHTLGGKMVAVVVSVSGIILLAFPISVIVEHFHEEYSGEAEQEKQKPEEPVDAAARDSQNQAFAAALVGANATLAQLINGMLQLEISPSITQRPKKRRHRRGFKL